MLFMRQNQIVFSFLLTQFENENLLRYHVIEMNFKNTDSLMLGEVKF